MASYHANVNGFCPDAILARHRPNKVVGRTELLHEIWGYLETPITRSVDHEFPTTGRSLGRAEF